MRDDLVDETIEQEHEESGKWAYQQ